MSHLDESLGLVEGACPSEFRSGVGLDEELAVSEPTGFLRGNLYQELAQALSVEIGIDGEPREPDVLRRSP